MNRSRETQEQKEEDHPRGWKEEWEGLGSRSLLRRAAHDRVRGLAAGQQAGGQTDRQIDQIIRPGKETGSFFSRARPSPRHQTSKKETNKQTQTKRTRGQKKQQMKPRTSPFPSPEII